MSHLTRALIGAFMAVLALLIAVSGASAASVAAAPAAAQAADCGVAKPSGETAVSSYKTLQTDLSSTTSATFYLTTSLADSTSTTGGLIPAGTNGDTINLNGCTLTISNAGVGNAGINITSAPLTIEDLSTNHDGVLSATGGAGTAGVDGNGYGTTTGAGAGIGSPGSVISETSAPTPATPDSFTVLSGTVNATGGTGPATSDASAGAGIGGGGGSTGGAGGDVTVSGPAVVNATGGSQLDGAYPYVGAGAGIGGGGGEYAPGYGTAASDAIDLNGGTIDATGGNGTAQAQAGAGIGGGSAPYGTLAGAFTGAVVNSTGGTLSATPGTATDTSFEAFGIQDVVNGLADFSAGTTVFSGSIDGGVAVGETGAATLDLENAELSGGSFEDTSGTINVSGGDTLTLDGVEGQEDIEPGNTFNGAFNLPANSALILGADSSNYFGGAAHLAGPVTVGQAAQISAQAGGNVTLENLVSPVAGSLSTAAGGTMTLPSSGTLTTTDDGLASDGTLVIPSGETVNIPSQTYATVGDGGAIDLYGTLTGAGTLDNEGSIALDGASASIPGNGSGANGQLTIHGNVYDLGFNVPSPGEAPASQWLYAPTLADGNVTLPAAPTISGYANNGGWIVSGADTSPASSGYVALTPTTVLDEPGDLYLSGNYQYSAVAVGQSESLASGQTLSDTATVTGGSYFGSPTGSVTYYACGPLASATACSATSGAEINQPATLTTGAADTSTASISYTPPSPGVWCLYAAYSGDASNLPAGKGTSEDCETVTGSSSTGTAPTMVTKPVSSLNPSVGGEPIKLSTTVSSTSGVVESGEVAFFNASNTTLCIAEVIGGKAACDTASAPVGTDKITAIYEGNAYFAASPMSAVLTQTVTPNSSFTVVSSSVAKASLNIKLKLSDSGTVRIAALVGKRRFVSTTRSEKVKNNSTVSIKLSLATLRKLEKGHRASSKVKVLLRITFTPAGSQAKAATKTKLVTLRVSQL